jgi:hypothetical protein
MKKQCFIFYHHVSIKFIVELQILKSEVKCHFIYTIEIQQQQVVSSVDKNNDYFNTNLPITALQSFLYFN